MIFISRMGLFHDSPKKNEEKTFTTNNKISLVGKRLAKCLKNDKIDLNFSKIIPFVKTWASVSKTNRMISEK